MRPTPPDPLVVLTRAYNEAVIELARERAECERLRERLGWAVDALSARKAG